MQKTIIINDKDCTELFKDSGYSGGEKKIEGDNGGLTLAGVQIEDILAIKDTLVLPLEPLSETDLCDLMLLLRNSKYMPSVKIYYFSTNYAAYRTAMFIRDDLVNTHYFDSNFGVSYYNSNFLSFVEN